jgi:hypothetical protein
MTAYHAALRKDWRCRQSLASQTGMVQWKRIGPACEMHRWLRVAIVA